MAECFEASAVSSSWDESSSPRARATTLAYTIYPSRTPSPRLRRSYAAFGGDTPGSRR